jgi:hypothetical protein
MQGCLDKLDVMENDFITWLQSQPYGDHIKSAVSQAYTLCESADNTQEALNEGAVGKAIGALGIAIGSLFSHAHADIDNLDLKTASEAEVNEIKTAFEQEDDISFCKLKSKGLVCKDTNNSVTLYPTESLANVGIDDNITEVIFLDGYKNPEHLSGVIFNYKNGSKKSITHKIGEKYGYVTILDEFDTEKSKSIVSPGKVEESVKSLYSDVIQEVDSSDQKSDLEKRIIQKYSNNKGAVKPQQQTATKYTDGDLTTSQNRQINDIMAKYRK